jgi:hypothetical protein
MNAGYYHYPTIHFLNRKVVDIIIKGIQMEMQKA